MNASSSFIGIKFDKSHLSSIGERLYTQSLDLIRELVSNAYDADALRVNIDITEDRMVVEDDGTGMDRGGLEQYFTIGSPFKRENPVSPKYKRVRIGEFGIGKFAVLSLCSRFELYTKSADYAATVIFDRQDFENKKDWDIPVVEHEAVTGKTGTRVTLYQIKKSILLDELERYLISIFPLNDRQFSIFLNGKKLFPAYVAGERFKIRESTKFGAVNGEIVISGLKLPRELTGVGLRVKGILVKRETFELENRHTLSSRRITGEIRADFLPITTDRSDFIKDNEEYKVFYSLIEKKLLRIIRLMEKQAMSYQDKKSEKILSDVLLMIRDALKRNHDIFMMGDLPLFTKKKAKSTVEGGIGETISSALVASKPKPAIEANNDMDIKKIVKNAVRNLKPRLRGRVKTLLKDERRIIKKIKFGGSELLVSFAHLGDEEKQSFVDGGIIFVNRDHALFKSLESKSDLIYYHLTRLVSQELVKFAYPKNLDIAFDWHGKLIADAYMGVKKLKAA